jgi:hypothetical protein
VNFTAGFTGYAAGANNCPEVSSIVSTVWNSSTSLTTTFVQTAGTTQCDVSVKNTLGNGAIATLAYGLGFGEASGVAPTITATSDTTPIVPGSSASTVTFTGTGFSQYDTAYATFAADGTSEGSTATTTTPITLSNPSGNNGTSETYTVSVVGTGTAIAGPVAVEVGTVAPALHPAISAPFAAGLLVAGPVVTSQSPTDIPVGDPIGSVIVLTGTGFTPTVAAAGALTYPLAGHTLTVNVNYVNATTVDLVVTASPSQADNGDLLKLTESDIAGVGTSNAISPKYPLVIGLAPSITGLVYSPSGATGIGLGATGQVVTIVGSNFKTGAVVGGFKNANGVADASVTAKVLSINTAGTQITASVAIAATDANTVDYFTVTNTDGGVASSSTTGVVMYIQAPPTVTSVSPSTATANSTVAFTITGTGFVSGASVAATADGTCGAATVVSATSVTVSCTFGTATAAAALVVTNPNGGTATSATVLGAATPPAPPAPHATGEAGNGIVGRTVSIAVAGVGFYGQPKVTSTGSSVRAVVSKDNGTLMTVQVTVGQTTGPGEHTLTFTLANGKVFKVNYLIIK